VSGPAARGAASVDFPAPGVLFSPMRIGWTTVANRADADQIAAALVEARWAVCVQIEGPITSHYRWEGRIQRDEEYRLMVKFLPEHLGAIEMWLGRHHPYDNPEWVVVSADHVAEKYLSWAQANSSSPPFGNFTSTT
jgi:periplasmic divalent cation tolerance protein